MPFTFLDRQTPSYTALLDEAGNLIIALADMELYNLFTPRRLRIRAVRNAIESTDFILTDANLPENTLTAIGTSASQFQKPLAAIAISPAKVVKLRPSLKYLDWLFMNTREAHALTGIEYDAYKQIEALKKLDLKAGTISNGGTEIYAFNKDEIVKIKPPEKVKIVDVTGAGDALASGFITAHISGHNLTTCLQWGIAASLITLATPSAVANDLNHENLLSTLKLVQAAD